MQPHSSRPRILLFFVVALATTLTLHAVPFLAQRGVIAGPYERYLPFLGLGAFGPLIAAFVAARVERNRVYRPLPRGSFAPHWYVVALCLFPTIYLAGMAVYAAFAGTSSRVLYLPESNEHIVGMILMPLLEEPAWRGYALPRLQARYSPLTAALVLGALWAVWHTFMFLVAGIAPTAGVFVLAYANIIVGSVVFSWLYNRTRGSLLIAVIAHVSVHINNPSHALPDRVAPFAVYTAAIAAFAIATLIFDRRAWAQGTQSSPEIVPSPPVAGSNVPDAVS